MATGTWEPGGAALPDADDLAAAAAFWRVHGSDEPDAEALGAELASPLRDRLRSAMQAPSGALTDVLSGLDPADAVDLARLLTVLEALPGFEAGARSPVVPIVRGLRARLDAHGDAEGDATGDADGDRDAFAELVRWIRAHTENRFLPHGSLQDRLQA